MSEGRSVRAVLALSADYSLIPQRLRVDLLSAFDRTRCAMDAAEQRLLHAMAAETAVYPDAATALDKQWVREDVACALRLSSSTAGDRLALAVELVERLPATLAALDAARISLAHARRLAEAVGPLSDEHAHQVEARVLPKAGAQTLAQFVAACARAVIAVDPRSADEREAVARRERRVRITPLPDGMAELLAILPAADAWAIKHILDTAAQHTAAQHTAAQHTADTAAQHIASTADPAGTASTDDPDHRCADERRADALVDLVLAGQHMLLADTAADTAADTDTDADTDADTDTDVDAGAELTSGQQRAITKSASARRRRALRSGPLFDITVAASTLTRADDEPAILAGYGPVTATTARRLAGDPTAAFRQLTVDASGRLLDVGRTSYRPPAHLARHVRLDADVCYFPGCRRRAAGCELDHLTSWNDQGTTSLANLRPGCPRHHHVKHDAGWRVRQLPDRTLRWTSPTGHSYDRPPPDHLPVDTTARGAPCSPSAPTGDGDPPPF